MRASKRPSRGRILAIGASVLVAAAALAAAAVPVPAQAGLTPVNQITLSPAGPLTDPVHATLVFAPITATETDPKATLTLSATGLPPGLSYSQVTSAGDPALTVTGVITTPGVYEVTVTAEDNLPAMDMATETFTWTAKNNVTVTAPAAETTKTGTAAAPVTVLAFDDDPITPVSCAATGLPKGLAFDAATDTIAGTPTAPAGVYDVTVKATDSTGATGSAVIKWTIAPDGHLGNPGPQAIAVGQGKDLVLTTAGYPSGDKMTWVATGLPAGMGFQPDSMTIYGWPTSAGTYRVTVTGHGAFDGYGTATFRLTVRPATGQGPAGQIRLALDGKCLRDPGGKTANGTDVTIGTCAAGTAQRWTIASDGTIRVNGRCLDIPGTGSTGTSSAGTSSAAGRELQLMSCTDSPREVWLPARLGQLANPASGLCVTDRGASEKDGAAAVLSACAARPAQQWTLPAQPVLASAGGSCAEADGGSVDESACDGAQRQTWSFRPDGTIRSGSSDECVTIPGRLGQAGTKIVLQTCAPDDRGQTWNLLRTGGLSSMITIGGYCLGLPSLTAANATQLVTVRCSTGGDPRVRWHIG